MAGKKCALIASRAKGSESLLARQPVSSQNTPT